MSVYIRDVTVWKFIIMIIVTKMITVIITVLFKCAGDVQKVPTPSFIFKNQQTTNKITK